MRAEALKLEILQEPINGDPKKLILKVISDEILIVVILRIDKTMTIQQKVIINQN